ncbi:MAG TPA: transglycosylase SLT domain-containing protein [Deltaproteobacteria bacterium]|nr:transglycosylase SLT domain-containing protein [Deltaproteobacteria bacterium]
MKVSSPDVLEQLIRNLPPGSGKGTGGSVSDPDDFSALLESMVGRPSDTASATMDREKLAAFLELVRIRMSQSVMNAFSDDGGQSSPSGFALAPDILASPREESKVGRSQGVNDIPVAPGDLDGIIDRASTTYGVDRDLIVSVIRAESGFDPKATSPKGAMGLMQLMPGTAHDLGVTDAYDPEQNVMGGTRHLRGLLERYDGDVRTALAAYNWGAGNLERSTGGLPEETRNYIARIMKDYGGAEG